MNMVSQKIDGSFEQRFMSVDILIGKIHGHTLRDHRAQSQLGQTQIPWLTVRFRLHGMLI